MRKVRKIVKVFSCAACINNSKIEENEKVDVFQICSSMQVYMGSAL